MNIEAEAFKALAEKYQRAMDKMAQDMERRQEHSTNMREWVDILVAALIETTGKSAAAQAVKKQLDSFPLRFSDDATKDDPDMVRIKTTLLLWAREEFDLE